MGTASTVAFVVAGAGVALAAFGWLVGGTAAAPRSTAHVHPQLLLGGAALEGEF